MARLTEYQRLKLAEYILRMREVCDDADRTLKRDADDQEPEQVIGTVLHDFAWGHANAYMSLQDLLCRLASDRQMEEARKEMKSNV